MIRKIQRIRDPIHGLIVFDEKDDTDMTAWELIQTPEFQRLRRIKQLGVGEFVFPGATHTRFAHSIGVYHNARKLMQIIKRELGNNYSKERAKTVLLAALLHDVGHGPFSHAFEGARKAISKQRKAGQILKHEKFSSLMITAEDGGIHPVLEKQRPGLAKEIAELLEQDDPSDFYHAVVSSSFDADRLDYLTRDRYMTGTHSGSIDEDWLLNNLTTHRIEYYQEDDQISTQIPTFVFTSKARQAAEDFLLARYRLYRQVYLHKVTRGFEKLITGLLQHVGRDETDKSKLGIPSNHPLMRFLAPGGENLDLYRKLDDITVWAVIAQLSQCDDPYAARLAGCLWNRIPMKTLDVSALYENDPDGESNAIRKLKAFITKNNTLPIFEDQPDINLYSEVSGEQAKAHKMVRVLDGGGHQGEIVEFADTIIGKNLRTKAMLTRFYFLDDDIKSQAEKAMRGG
jgi:HD superfamily phosphohydrolase